jgi:hypothetical protein
MYSNLSRKATSTIKLQDFMETMKWFTFFRLSAAEWANTRNHHFQSGATIAPCT